MKRSTLNHLAALGCAALLTGCLFPRYTTIEEKFPTDEEQTAVAPKEGAAAEVNPGMTPEQASAIVKDALATPPAGRRPSHPGDRRLGKYTTSIRLRKHNRTGLVLVEVKEGQRVTLEFYVRTRKDGEKFAAAVWRLRREYLDK